jgi:RNA recognition motif-containing protein
MNIYISNLDTNLTDNDLQALFAPYGQVQSATIAIDGFTDLSRGFGHVVMPNENEALSAIAGLNQSEINTRIVSVREAETQEIRRGSYKVGNPAVHGYKFRKN